MDSNYYLWLIPTLPLIGAAWNGLAGRNASERRVAAVALGSMALSLLLAARAVWMLGTQPVLETHPTWIAAAGFRVGFDLQLDPLSAVMILVVTGVGLLIHVYAVGYMAGDPGFYRFFAFLNLFVFFMLLLVLAGNYLLLFAGWEGVGLCSYLLIGYYFRKPEAAAAGKKAFLVNRVGDFGFLIALLLMYQMFHSLHFTEVFSRAAQWPVESGEMGGLTWICLLLLVGATGKSAQVPLYVWLPDAMAGPTPVSALIHAATMVTAGVYVIARSSVLYLHAPQALLVVAVVGALTALYAATIAVAQTDIKRVLAYSTISQIGYMVMACGVAAFAAGVFHLMTHAFFKALLFLGAGSVIHGLHGEQDLRRMGGLKQHLPRTYWTMLIACLAIAAIPPFAGFWSKDAILWEAFSSPHGGPAFWMVGILTAGLTSFYMFRLFFLAFHGAPRDRSRDGHVPAVPHESPAMMTWPLLLLALLSLAGGWIGIPALWGGEDRLGRFLAPVFQPGFPEAAHATEHAAAAEWFATGVSLAVSVAGIALAWLFYVRRPELPARCAAQFRGLYGLVANKYYVDELYNFLFVRPLVLGASEVLWKGVDVAAIDGAVNAVARRTRRLGDAARRMQSGNLRSYAGWVALGSVALIVFMVLVAS
ncbi:MAG TPA: NADH-quinone oxidoreductase subunit L [Terriglobia bacterium]|nr:NADH-quinone oxidoreductase subunit L [Terriglobia bacterium]